MHLYTDFLIIDIFQNSILQYKIKLNSNNKTFNAEYNPSNIKIPNKDDWIITLWHIHRDSYEEYFGEKVIYRAF